MIDIIKTSLMITGFVLAMMLIIEYVNVASAGAWQKRLAQYTWGQYIVAAFLGATPGCLGAFAAVAMYSHGLLSLGAVVTAMIAASGDEAFVMLALIPKQAFALMGILFVFGVIVGILVDLAGGKRHATPGCLTVHPQDIGIRFSRRTILNQWRACSAARGCLMGFLAFFLAGVALGQMGPPQWDWVRWSLVVVSSAALFVVSTVPDHFLDEHLWHHVVREHGLRILLWTSGTLATMNLLINVLHLEQAIQHGQWVVLTAACLVGLIPESGPHLIFVTLFAQGLTPFSVLLASSIVQDGHGMLPMLAYSRSKFLIVKAITFTAGMGLGILAMSLGF
jgi:hypothetical protein